MHAPQDQNDSQPISNRQALYVLLALFRAWSISLEVFVRHRLGVRYPGPLSALVLLLVPIYCLFWEGHDLFPMLYFLGAYIVMCARHRITVAYRYWTGTEGSEHSYYSGRPYLLSLLPVFQEIPMKGIIEPAVIVGIGMLVTVAWNEPLGWYLILGAACMSGTVLLSELMHRFRRTNLRDQVIEQRQIMQDLRRR